ncbi:putative Asp/Glu/hydantoin racemase [Seiridium cardinale]|uniref:Asp/Glu/hydantoin racemase n=1 Tax=Seiridium cardinale TaxID=138064 RepID=A0ABR2Y3K2_9PEZI
MKRLLLLGGMTPDVTVLYYNAINHATRAALGGRHNAPLHLYSADLEAMVQFAGAGDWDGFAKVYTDAIEALVDKVDGVVVCAILAHKVSGRLNRCLASTKIPLLHIADYVGQYLKTNYPHIRTLGLLGPKITMLGGDDPDFFIGHLQSPEQGFEVLVPETPAELEEVNRGLMNEVAKGASAVTPQTKEMFLRQALKLVGRGVQAIILGSTDLGFVLHQEDLGDNVVLIEPALIHAEGAARWALES